MGLSSIFSRNAELSAISDSNVPVDEIYQKAVIEVRENVTEGATGQGLCLNIYASKFLLLIKMLTFLVFYV